MSMIIDLSRKGNDESLHMMRNGTMIWGTNRGLTQEVVDLVEGEKLRHLANSGHKTHRRWPTESRGMRLRHLVELILNKWHDTLASLTQLEDSRPKFKKGMTNMESMDLPSTQHMMWGGCHVQERPLPIILSLFLFPFPNHMDEYSFLVLRARRR